MRDIHCKIAVGPGELRHVITPKGLTAGYACVLAAAGRNDVGAAVHVPLGFVEITGIEGREDHIPVLVRERAGAVDVFLAGRLNLQSVTVRRILSSIGSPFSLDSIARAGLGQGPTSVISEMAATV
jgi:hypothetical protein